MLEPLINSDITSSQFVNTIAHLVHQDANLRQRFIEEDNLMKKAELVEEALHLILLKGRAIDE